MSVYQESTYHEETRVATGSRQLLFFVPTDESLRVFRRHGTNGWLELGQGSYIAPEDTNSFSFDRSSNSVITSSRLVSTELKFQYTHNGAVNPGAAGLVPLLLKSWGKRLNFMIKDGLYLTRSYVNGMTGWNGWTMTLAGGSVLHKGTLYTLPETHHDLNKFGGSAGNDVVTGIICYLTSAVTTSTQYGQTVLLPQWVRSGRHMLGADGNGIQSGLSDCYNKLKEEQDISRSSNDYIEIFRGVVISKGIDPPELHVEYTPKYRVLDFAF